MPSSKSSKKHRPSHHRMDFRLSRDHKALIEKAAAYSGETLTGFAVATLVDEARRIVREHETVALTTRDRDRFVELLDNPSPPPETLRRAKRRYNDVIVRSD